MFQGVLLPLAPATSSSSVGIGFLERFGPTLLGLGWVMLIMLLLWIVWEVYLLLKRIDYVSSIQWTFLQMTIPPESQETPKAMEVAYEVFGGMHKSGDLVEVFFDGYVDPWFSFELHCQQGRARYILVVPTGNRQLFEGVLYGQYPQAEIREVEDYSQRFRWQDIREKFDLWASEVKLVEDDFYPIKTYREFENILAEEDKLVDPHQAIVEAFTNVNPGEEYWLQFCIRPMDAKYTSKWSLEGQAEVAKISGQAKEAGPGVISQLGAVAKAFPTDLLSAAFNGPSEGSNDRDEQTLRFFNPVDEAKMKGILQKVSQTGFKTTIRVIHIAPAGQLAKPNIARAFGVFKQFNTFHLNSLKPDGATKTNGPNYFLRDTRRKFRERLMLLSYQSRDMFTLDAGNWLTAEELATLYHLPSKYAKGPGIERAKAGLQSPPSNLPYA